MNWGALFPGQGSQHPGMGKFLYDNFASARQTFEEASDALSLNMSQLCFEGSESDLALTHNTQPALLTVSVASHRVLAEVIDFRPQVGAGHSVGEYAAVVTAQAMAFSDALRSVRRRGELMQSAVPVGVGGMAAILGWEDEQIKSLCSWVTSQSGCGILEPANFNSPGQVVISGHTSALDWLQTHYSADAFSGAPARLKMIRLNVSAPFHCSLMKPAKEGMRAVLSEVRLGKPTFKVVQNFKGTIPQTMDEMRENLIRQVSAPVLWVSCMAEVLTQGVTHVIEVGCGKVLSGLAKKTVGSALATLNLNSLEDLKLIEATAKGGDE